MDKDQNNPSGESNKGQGSDLPGTSKDPTGQVITDKPAQGQDRSGPSSERGRSGSRDPNSGTKKG
jgi:hypothetical protein